MIEKIWELFTSGEKVDRWLTRISLFGFVVAVFLIAYYMSIKLLIVLGVIIFGVIFVVITMKNAEKKAVNEWRKILEEDDDGETGYIAVRPEELEGPPWEIKRNKE